jgi:hypothetical protein
MLMMAFLACVAIVCLYTLYRDDARNNRRLTTPTHRAYQNQHGVVTDNLTSGDARSR